MNFHALKILLFTVLVLESALLQARNTEKQLNAGLDLWQMRHYFKPGKQGLNVGLFGQFKPKPYLEFNVSGYYNNVYLGPADYIGLNQYRSKGMCVKAGLSLSLKMSKKNKDKRAFIGWNLSGLTIRETGSFAFRDLYWSPYENGFDVERGIYFVNEMTFGFQLPIKKKFMLRIQSYKMLLRDDSRISYSSLYPVPGFRSPFIPGFGMHRAGLNLILMYRI